MRDCDRRDQRQVDCHRHGRLDHDPGGPRSDDHERRGDEEFRLAGRALRLGAGRTAVLNNVSLDHKSLEELRELFGAFLGRAEVAAINLDDAETAALAPSAKALVTFGIDSGEASIGVAPGSVIEGPAALAATVLDRRDGSAHQLQLKVPGRHNLANALAAIAGCNAAGVTVGEAVAALGTFTGLARRFDIVGTSPSGIRLTRAAARFTLDGEVGGGVLERSLVTAFPAGGTYAA